MENIKFSKELANKKMIAHLSRVKQAYISEKDKTDATEKRIENIDAILSDNKLLEKFVDIKLTDDILYMIQNVHGPVSTGNNLLASSIDGSLSVLSSGELLVDGKYVCDLIGDEYRKFLYDIVGFVYQSYDEVYGKSDSEVMDPLASGEFKSYNTIYLYLDNIDAIKECKVPRYINESKDTMAFRIGQIRKELAESTSNLAGLTTVEIVGSACLPYEAREIVFKSILRMLQLQKELLILESQSGVNEYEMEDLNKNIEYWAKIVGSGDYYRSHHKSR